MKRLKWNKQSIGLVVGVLAPIISFLVMYLLKHDHISFGDYLRMLKSANMVSSLLSLCVVPNLLFFFMFIWSNLLKSARGVLMATFVMAVIVLGFKILM